MPGWPPCGIWRRRLRCWWPAWMGWSTPGWSDARACQAGGPGCGAGEAVLRRTVAPARRCCSSTVGAPRTHTTWHRVAPPLTGEYTVVCPDLRGYGGGVQAAPVAVLGETGHVAASTR